MDDGIRTPRVRAGSAIGILAGSLLLAVGPAAAQDRTMADDEWCDAPEYRRERDLSVQGAARCKARRSGIRESADRGAGEERNPQPYGVAWDATVGADRGGLIYPQRETRRTGCSENPLCNNAMIRIIGDQLFIHTV